jgi:hypothetical protein
MFHVKHSLEVVLDIGEHSAVKRELQEQAAGVAENQFVEGDRG